MSFIICPKLYISLHNAAIPPKIVEMKSGLKSQLEYTDGATVTKFWSFPILLYIFKFLYFLSVYA
jgi:hypothetical protein